MRRLVAFLTVLTSCTSGTVYSSTPMQDYDKDTRYVIEPRAGGFTLSIEYSRYQFIPESGAIVEACRSALTSLAYELSDRQGHAIDKINEQRIRLSTGRNGLTGITSCSATVAVDYTERNSRSTHP